MDLISPAENFVSEIYNFSKFKSDTATIFDDLVLWKASIAINSKLESVKPFMLCEILFF